MGGKAYLLLQKLKTPASHFPILSCSIGTDTLAEVCQLGGAGNEILVMGRGHSTAKLGSGAVGAVGSNTQSCGPADKAMGGLLCSVTMPSPHWLGGRMVWTAVWAVGKPGDLGKAAVSL